MQINYLELAYNLKDNAHSDTDFKFQAAVLPILESVLKTLKNVDVKSIDMNKLLSEVKKISKSGKH